MLVEVGVLAEALMEIKVAEDTSDKYGAFKVGTHDDLVTALGLAFQEEGPRRLILLGGWAGPARALAQSQLVPFLFPPKQVPSLRSAQDNPTRP